MKNPNWLPDLQKKKKKIKKWKKCRKKERKDKNFEKKEREKLIDAYFIPRAVQYFQSVWC